MSDEINREKFGVFVNKNKGRGVTEIGNDVWVGHNVVILPGCKKVGNGAVIGAGSIVTHDVPPYSIVAGNPAKVINMRFNDETIERLESSKWWEMSANELHNNAGEIQSLIVEDK